MKNTNRQISSVIGRSTKKNNAGLSLLRPRLFIVVEDTYKYFNEIFISISSVISKSISPFIVRLTQKKFFLDICEREFAFSYLHPHANAAIFFHLTGDRFYYDYHGLKF